MKCKITGKTPVKNNVKKKITPAEHSFILIQYIVPYFYWFLYVTWLCGVVFKALSWSEPWAFTAVASSKAPNLRLLWEDCHCNELMVQICRNVSSKSQKTDSTSPDQAADFFFFFLPFSVSLTLILLPESGQPICGNGLVEANEECDCGYSDQCKDKCCYNANEPEELKCKLKTSAKCRCSKRTLTVCLICIFSSNLVMR